MSCGLTSETNRQNGRPSTLAREIKSSTLSPPTASLPFVLAGETLHPFDQNPPVPGAIENDDLSQGLEAFPKNVADRVPAAFVR